MLFINLSAKFANIGKRMKKVLVTGGAGYIGSHTIVELIQEGIEPIILDSFGNSEKSAVLGIEKILGKAVQVYEIDLLNKEALRTVFEENDISGVIHFAAWKAVGESVQNPLKYYHNNITGLVNLLECTQEFKVNNVVFSSSCTVYGQPDILPVSELAPEKKAESPYGFTKQIGEQVLRDFHRSEENFSAVLLRYFNPIGAHPSSQIGELPLGTPNNLVPFITQTAAGIREKLTVFGSDYNTPDGTCIRDYIHVCDLAKAHVKALFWLDKNPGKIDAFNIGTGQGNTVLEVIHAFEKVSGKKLNYSIGDRRGGDIEKVYADNTKALKELGWKAEKTLDNSMLDAWNWQRKLKEI
jgi:UDP-glucose 4-epimerase